MNTDIEIQKKLKAKFTVTITKNMGLKDLIQALDRIPPPLAGLIPGLSQIISAANTAITVQEGARLYTEIATTAYTESQGLLEDATSTIYTGGATTSLRATAESSKLQEIAKNQAMDILTAQTFESLASLV